MGTFFGLVFMVIGITVFVICGAAAYALHLFFIVPCLMGLLTMVLGSKMVKRGG